MRFSTARLKISNESGRRSGNTVTSTMASNSHASAVTRLDIALARLGDPTARALESDDDDEDEVLSHPVHVLWNNFKKVKKSDKKAFDFSPYRIRFNDFLSTLQLEESCRDVYVPKRHCKCTCLKDLTLDIVDTHGFCNYMVTYSTKKECDRKDILVEWIKYAHAREGEALSGKYAYTLHCFLLPGTTRQLICTHALARIVGKNKDAWGTVSNAAKFGYSLTHGLVGQAGNRVMVDSEKVMSDYLSELQELGAPRATRIVRILTADGLTTKTELRDDDVELIELPNHVSQFGYYKRLVAKLGWRYEYDPKGRIINRAPIEGVDQAEVVPGWRTFIRLWKKEFPKMVIPKAGEDICDKCYQFANQIKYKQRRSGKEGMVDALLDDDYDGVADIVQLPFKLDDGESIDTQTTKEKRALESEELILAAAKHVEMEQTQRKYFQDLKQQAFDGRDLPREKRRFAFVADYAQNMGVPNFAGEQPGETYYFSPLNGYVFGVVDCSTKPTQMAAHTYFEMDGKKGGNNVASMMWNELERQGLTTGPTVPEIVMVFDNCAGQNKNRHVLRLLSIMVARKMTKLARCSFLVKGHTKNDCDRMYNQMKQRYRSANCYTPDDMCVFIDTSSDDITLVRVGGFSDWDTYEDKYIYRPELFLQYHVFTVTAVKPNVLQCQEAIDRPIVELKMVKQEFHGTNWADTLLTELRPLAAPGLRDIKWKTMYDQWRKYIPEHKRRTFKYYSVDPGAARRNKIKANTQKASEIRQKRSVTQSVSTAQEAAAAAVPKRRKAAATKKDTDTKKPAAKRSKKSTKKGSKTSNVI